MTGIYQVYTSCHIHVIYLVYTCHMKLHSLPGIYLVYTFPMKSYAPPGCRISIAMQQHTGFGLQGCLMFCRMWRRCHWASASQPEGRAVARLGPRRQSLAAYVGGTARPPTPTAAAAGQSRRRRRRRRGRRWWGHAASAEAHCRGGAGAPPPMTTTTTKQKSCRLDVDFKSE